MEGGILLILLSVLFLVCLVNDGSTYLPMFSVWGGEFVCILRYVFCSLLLLTARYLILNVGETLL